MAKHKDISPETPVARLSKERGAQILKMFSIGFVAPLVGMSETYIRKALDKRVSFLDMEDIHSLLDLDAFSETFVPRSKIPAYLKRIQQEKLSELRIFKGDAKVELLTGSATDVIRKLPEKSVQCVVTSTPYWGTRIYDKSVSVEWADGETCPYGHEQTPEGFVRHSVELLNLLRRVVKDDGSVWWNVMDTYNTRTQIRANAAETLRAMQGKDTRGWKDHAARRYSAGHSFLKDGELCMVPERIAERASRIGYFTKSMITWKKTGSMPETVSSRVTRELEYIIHLSPQRTPKFFKANFSKIPSALGGRDHKRESEKITDVWFLPTSSGRDGHGAQFPLSLPGRCIALSTQKGDTVLDPFIGSGTTAVAALKLGRRCIGIDVNEVYLRTADAKIKRSLL